MQIGITFIGHTYCGYIKQPAQKHAMYAGGRRWGQD